MAATTDSAQIRENYNAYDGTSRSVPLALSDSLLGEVPFTGSVSREDVVVDGARVFLLHGLLSDAECDYLVNSTEVIGFDRHSDVKNEYPEDYRSNQRLIVLSKPLADTLWRRVQPHLHYKDIAHIKPLGWATEGLWLPNQINDGLLFSKYSKGNFFRPHYDGMYKNQYDECSIYSVTIYLNDNYTGGRVLFMKNKDSREPEAKVEAQSSPWDNSYETYTVGSGWYWYNSQGPEDSYLHSELVKAATYRMNGKDGKDATNAHPFLFITESSAWNDSLEKQTTTHATRRFSAEACAYVEASLCSLYAHKLTSGVTVILEASHTVNVCGWNNLKQVEGSSLQQFLKKPTKNQANEDKRTPQEVAHSIVAMVTASFEKLKEQATQVQTLVVTEKSTTRPVGKFFRQVVPLLKAAVESQGWKVFLCNEANILEGASIIACLPAFQENIKFSSRLFKAATKKSPYDDLSNSKLLAEITKRGLYSGGTQQDLIERLVSHDRYLSGKNSKYKDMTWDDLKQEMRNRGLNDVGGIKSRLIAKLLDNDEKVKNPDDFLDKAKKRPYDYPKYVDSEATEQKKKETDDTDNDQQNNRFGYNYDYDADE